MSGLTGRQKKTRPPRPPGATEANRSLRLVDTSLRLETPFDSPLNRIQSSPSLNRPTSADAFSAHPKSDAPSSADNRSQDLTADQDPRSAIRNIFNDAVDHLSDATRKNMSSTLARFYTTIATQDIFRRLMMDDIDWQIESCLTALTHYINRGKKLKSGSACLDAIRASKCIILILVCIDASSLQNNVSGMCFDSLITTCVDVLPPLSRQSNDKGYSVNSHLLWLVYLILGELLRLNLASCVVPSATDTQNENMEWTEWYRLQCERLLRRKRNQLKSLKEEKTLTWTPEEVVQLDGLCLSMASWLCGMGPLQILSNRQSTGAYGFIWRFVDELGSLMALNPVEVVNTYFGGMPNEIVKNNADTITCGLVDFLGLCYEAWWERMATNMKSEDVSIPHSDVYWGEVVRVFGGRASTVDAKNVSKALTKTFMKLFRDLETTIEAGRFTSPATYNISKVDVHDGVKEMSPAHDFVGEALYISNWNNSHLYRICREFGGAHGCLAFAIQMQGHSEVFAGSAIPRDKNDKGRLFAQTRKFQKQERRYQSAVKSAQQQMGWLEEDY